MNHMNWCYCQTLTDAALNMPELIILPGATPNPQTPEEVYDWAIEGMRQLSVCRQVERNLMVHKYELDDILSAPGLASRITSTEMRELRTQMKLVMTQLLRFKEHQVKITTWIEG